jgi:hypothetical protein
MSCTYIDLPPRFTAIPGKQMVKVEIRSSSLTGAEVVYSFAMPRDVFLASIASAQTAYAELEGREANVVAFPLPPDHAETA